MQNIHPSVFVHPSALLYGVISIGEDSSVWPNVVMRAEVHDIRIGRMANIQDFVMIHTSYDGPTIVGDHCSITHHVTLHGCIIEDDCLIGIGATVMDGARIGAGSIVAGGAFVPEGRQYPPHSIIMGAPAEARSTRDSRIANRLNAHVYRRNARAYAAGDHRAWHGDEFSEWFAATKAALAAETAAEDAADGDSAGGVA